MYDFHLYRNIQTDFSQERGTDQRRKNGINATKDSQKDEAIRRGSIVIVEGAIMTIIMTEGIMITLILPTTIILNEVTMTITTGGLVSTTEEPTSTTRPITERGGTAIADITKQNDLDGQIITAAMDHRNVSNLPVKTISSKPKQHRALVPRRRAGKIARVSHQRKRKRRRTASSGEAVEKGARRRRRNRRNLKNGVTQNEMKTRGRREMTTRGRRENLSSI